MRFFGLLLFTATLGAPLLGACSSGGRGATLDTTGTTSSAIQGGTNDTADTFAVGVCLPANGLSGPGDCGGVCSGVLIAPNLVVTARHCVDSISSDNVDCSTATFGGLSFPESSFWITTAPTMTQSTTGWHQVKTVSVPTSTMLCGNDLAVLELVDVIAATEAAPATPAVQYPIYNHLHYSTAETAIGYGESTPGLQTSAETRRERQNTPITCVFDDPISGEDCVTQSSSWAVNARPNEFVAGAGTCQGDSGSGAFDQTLFQAGMPTALGVLSRSSTDVDASTCSSAIYTRMDSFRDLLVDAVTVAAADGAYTLPSWTAAEPDDGVYPDGGAADSGATTTTTPDSGTTSTPPAGLGGVCSPGHSLRRRVLREQRHHHGVRHLVRHRWRRLPERVRLHRRVVFRRQRGRHRGHDFVPFFRRLQHGRERWSSPRALGRKRSYLGGRVADDAAAAQGCDASIRQIVGQECCGRIK